jgi:hypothetical protein
MRRKILIVATQGVVSLLNRENFEPLERFNAVSWGKRLPGFPLHGDIGKFPL